MSEVDQAYRAVRDNVTALARSCAQTTPVPACPEWTVADLCAHLDEVRRRAGPRAGAVMLMDAFTHELDLRAALGVPFPAEHRAFEPAFAVLRSGFAGGLEDNGLPGLRLSTEDGEWPVGSAPAGTLIGHRYDLYRSLAGRRTPGQIRALDWTTSPAPFLPAFTWGPFTPPTRPVEG